MFKSLSVLFMLFIVVGANVLIPLRHERITQDIHTNIVKTINSISQVDRQLALYVNHLGGGIYDEEIGAIVPSDPKQVRHHLYEMEAKVNAAIGFFATAQSPPAEWVNGANTIEELMSNAKEASPLFKTFVQEAASEVEGAIASFGEDEMHLLKTKRSIESKLRRMMKVNHVTYEVAVARIIDLLRGSIAIDSIDQLHAVMTHLSRGAKKRSWEILFHNIWPQKRASGYAAIHAWVYLPNEKMLSEIQLHFKEIYDGSKESLQQCQHRLYEQMKDSQDEILAQKCNDASVLLYAVAVENLLKNEPLGILPFKLEDLNASFISFCSFPFSSSFSWSRNQPSSHSFFLFS